MQEQSYQYGMDTVYLAACALHDRVPEWDNRKDLTGLYKFCKFHSLTSIVAMALEAYWKENPPGDPEVMKPWQQAKNMAIRKNILLNAEREKILGHLERIGCWYMPLKGSLLQYDYPKFGMRQMSDNDILFDSAFQQEVHDYMCANGYKAETYNTGNHDEYLKMPVYNVEMHRELFMNSTTPVLYGYYRDIRQRLVKDERNSFGYHMSREDFYIYQIAHAYKHYIHGGIGIRNLLDVYVYLSRHGQKLDRDYVNGELEKIEAAEFERECCRLGEMLFSAPVQQPALSDSDREILNLYFTSGAYGTVQRDMENRLGRIDKGNSFAAKLKYLWQRLFPSVAHMIDRNPELAKKRWKIPFAYIGRLFTGIFLRRQDTAKEVQRLKKTGNTDKQ